jgi:hypothetical protein
MVTSGTVSVFVNGISAPLSYSVTANPRSWKTGPASPASVPNGTFYTLPVPPTPTGLDAGLGEFLENTGNSGTFYSIFISDNGPNNGYGYYATEPAFTTSFQYEISPALVPGSTFYTEQCGNYNAQTKPSGYISGSNLTTQTNRHEWNSATESHYAFYSNSIAGANNPGNYVEARIATPGTSQETFDTTTGSGLNNATGPGSCLGTGIYQLICQNTSVEPYAVNEDSNGNFLGNINYAPYASCN